VRTALRWVALGLCVSCREATLPYVERPVPANLVVTSTPTPSVTVGTGAGSVGVKVLDEDGAPIAGVVVSFAVTRGNGALGKASVHSAADGIATTTFSAGTTVGLNELRVFVEGLSPVSFSVTGTVGQARTIVLNQRTLRFSTSTDSLQTTATPRDTFFNATGASITWVPRDTTLVSTSNAGGNSIFAKVLRRPGTTYLVASSGAASDSITIVVHDSASTPCTFLSSPASLAVGGALQFDGGTACITSLTPGAEYAVVAHLSTPAYRISQSFEVSGDGIVPVGAFPTPSLAANEASFMATGGGTSTRNYAFERRMRDQEAREIAPRVEGARSAARRTGGVIGGASNILPALPTVGALVSLNVNADDFCARPKLRQGRIAAISKTALIIADIDNPPGGFTDADYREFGDRMDTLVVPIDTAAFGNATDLDRNGRIAVFFTRAVNELTGPGSPDGVVLGFFYLRDLLPRVSAFGDCPGSNLGEMFYVLVPDVMGDVNGNVRTKSFVSGTVVSTIAHEYQHLINASRRMYVTNAVRVDEDVWLNEGLSHIAEELVFYRAAGLAPRANLGAAQLGNGTAERAAFDQYQIANHARYQQFLRFPESTSPMANDDLLQTRGATWAYLRYLVDRVRPADGDFWRRLVDSRWNGVVNLDSALSGTGVTALSAMRDWSTAVLTDDNLPSAAAIHQQASWNFFSALTSGLGGFTYPLAPRVLQQSVTTAVGVLGGGTSFLRFGVAQGKEALIRVTAQGGGTLPPGMRLTIVRIK
jgi:hypothetical protein